MSSFIRALLERGAEERQSLTDPAIIERMSAWTAALATFCIVTLALGAGLAAAYGRELQAGRSPNRSWWIARLLLLPLLAIGATAASEAFALSRSSTAFTAAMLSLGGYDCLRLVEAHWRARVNMAEGKSGDDQRGPAPTESDGLDQGHAGG
jgi:hypothetical protein